MMLTRSSSSAPTRGRARGRARGCATHTAPGGGRRPPPRPPPHTVAPAYRSSSCGARRTIWELQCSAPYTAGARAEGSGEGSG